MIDITFENSIKTFNIECLNNVKKSILATPINDLVCNNNDVMRLQPLSKNYILAANLNNGYLYNTKPNVDNNRDAWYKFCFIVFDEYLKQQAKTDNKELNNDYVESFLQTPEKIKKLFFIKPIAKKTGKRAHPVLPYYIKTNSIFTMFKVMSNLVLEENLGELFIKVSDFNVVNDIHLIKVNAL